MLGAILQVFVAIFQLIWEIRFCGSSILGGIIGGISAGCIKGGGDVKCVFIINFILLLFLFFIAVVKYGADLQFLNEYEELESVNQVSWAG